MSSKWRLPTKAELEKIYTQFQQKGLGNFSSDFYWSSSEYDSDHAWNVYFGDSYQGIKYKSYGLRVRLVRDLKEDENCEGMTFTLDGKSFEIAKEDEPRMEWHEAMLKFGIAEEDNSLETKIVNCDVWRIKANFYLYLLSLVKDDVKNVYTLGLIKAALAKEEGK